MDDLKKVYAKKVYRQCHSNLAVTAKKLSISPRSLKNLINEEAFVDLRDYEPTI